MSSLKELRNRIASVKATQKITRAMQMVAASKLRRAQEAALSARPYAQSLNAAIANLAQSASDGAPPLLAGTGRDDVHLLVVASAERGLCGGFNSSIARLARTHIRTLLAHGKQVKILCVGRKAADSLKRDFAHLMLDDISFRAVKSIGFAHAEEVATQILSLFEAREFDVCTIFYAEFINVITQKPKAVQMIPALIEDNIENNEAVDLAGIAYEYEPEEKDILETLLPRTIATHILRALLENAASEQGARMSAMDNATRNAGDMIDNLSITYNRTRQAQITKELIEIISGAEAL